MADVLFHGDLVNANRLLYTPSDFAKKSLLYLQEIGELTAQKPHRSQRENLSSYLFFIVLAGSGILQYDGKVYHLATGDCVFIDCHHAYYHESSDNLWKLRWIHFNGFSMPSIEEKYRERGGYPFFHPKNLADFSTCWKTLFVTAHNESYVRDMQVNTNLARLLSLILAENWHPELRQLSTNRDNLQEIQSYLEEHYPERVTLDNLAKRFYINKYYLTRVFKETFGQTLNQRLIQIRITHAKQLLRFTKKPIEMISLECGFRSPEYFARMFKNIEGTSASVYRQRW